MRANSQASFLRIVPVVVVATLLFSGIALCGVAATEGAEFSVESFETTPTPRQNTTETIVSGSAGAAALGLTSRANDVGLDLGAAAADVPLDDPSVAQPTQSLTIPTPVPNSSQIQLPTETGVEAAATADEAATVEAPNVGEFDESGVSTSQTEIEPAPDQSGETPDQSGETIELEADEASELETIDTDRQPFAAVGGITLYGPADKIRAAGFHESANTQALEMRALDSPLETMVMPSRGRGTGEHTAADMAVYPDEMIYSPVTGTVVDARAYKLYCKYDDHVVIIEPDAADDRRVKVLHLGELLVENGDRVVAGKTPIASGPTPLPFSSQIDSFIEDSTFTHVHIETVDLNLVDATNSTTCP